VMSKQCGEVRLSRLVVTSSYEEHPGRGVANSEVDGADVL